MDLDEFPADGSNFIHIPRFCLILRQVRQGFFEIVGHAEVYGKSWLRADKLQCPCLQDTSPALATFHKQLALYLDAEDAVAYVLSGREDRGEERLRNGGPLDSEPLHYINRRFARTRFSSLH
jgi:hypothetical protein